MRLRSTDGLAMGFHQAAEGCRQDVILDLGGFARQLRIGCWEGIYAPMVVEKDALPTCRKLDSLGWDENEKLYIQEGFWENTNLIILYSLTGGKTVSRMIGSPVATVTTGGPGGRISWRTRVRMGAPNEPKFCQRTVQVLLRRQAHPQFSFLSFYSILFLYAKFDLLIYLPGGSLVSTQQVGLLPDRNRIHSPYKASVLRTFRNSHALIVEHDLI